MPARVNTIALEGVNARPVEVEVDVANGLPALNLVGLPEGAVREAKDRIRSALNNSGFMLPARRITINLAPASLPKDGSGYDLPMALGLLAAMGKIPQNVLDDRLVWGELALDGRIKPVAGCLPANLLAREMNYSELLIPFDNGVEAALVPEVPVIGAATILELVRHLLGEMILEPIPVMQLGAGEPPLVATDMAEVKGQEMAKQALEVAAAGGHNMLMTGSPGSGKTLLARCLPGILPPLSLNEALEVTSIYSVAGKLPRQQPLKEDRPFRAPHHTASQVALIGGGGVPRPGEVSLAHRGVLFLDELPEYGRRTLEVLREPLEAGDVTISRAARSATFPARFQLLAACNPCPCGHHGNPHQICKCRPDQRERYQARLSGPLLDRIDLHVVVPPVTPETMVELANGEPSAAVLARVVAARAIQNRRNGEGVLNSALSGAQVEVVANLGDAEKNLLYAASKKLGFSARTFHRILKVARTVADLAGVEQIEISHLAMAIQLRMGNVADTN